MRWTMSWALCCAPGLALAGVGSVRLTDGGGLTWALNDDVAASEAVSGAAADATFAAPVAASTAAGGTALTQLGDLFDGYARLAVSVEGAPAFADWYAENGPSTVDDTGPCAGQVVRFAPQAIDAAAPTSTDPDTGRYTTAPLTVWRSVYVPSDDDYVRWTDSVRNDGEEPVVVRLRLSGELASGADTDLITTSTGGLRGTPDDVWLTLGQLGWPVEPLPRLGVLLAGPGPHPGVIRLVDALDGRGEIQLHFRLALAPGETGSIATFATGQPTRDAALARVLALYDDPDAQVRCLTGQEQASLQNIHVCPPADACGSYTVDPATGACVREATHEGETCDDGDACTRDDVCGAGVCAGVVPDEVCNGVDDDCDLAVDDADASVVGQPVWFTDADGDSFGAPGVTTLACAQPTGAVADAQDCDDADPAAFPGAPEVCGGGDDDCDGAADDSDLDVDPATLLPWYADLDFDGFGAGEAHYACAYPGVIFAGDCDDADAGRSPGAAEVCGTGDEDCDGLVDLEDPGLDPDTRIAWYADADGDLQGTGAAVYACGVLPQSARNALDCDDADPTVYVGGTERCDAADRDEDCDGLADDADEGPEGLSVWFVDLDRDGFGGGAARTACDPRSDERAAGGDCDDASAAAAPGLAERCDGVDNDCDGLADDADPDVDPAGFVLFYADADGDGFGDFVAQAWACAAPDGFVANLDDCDDGAADRSPRAPEVCDGADNNCDGLVDDDDRALDPTTRILWYRDADGDGDGQGAPVLACAAPPGHVYAHTDCDDLDPAAYGGAVEVCGGADEDCDGAPDDLDPEGAEGEVAWWADVDQDGFGAGEAVFACFGPVGSVTLGADCDDADPAVSPAASERCGGGDEDCDGLLDDADADVVDAAAWFVDEDGDGFGAAAGGQACALPAGAAAAGGDCDDADVARSPGVAELCNGGDDDCDGVADDGLPCGPADTDTVPGETDTVDPTDSPAVDTDAPVDTPAADDTDNSRPIGEDTAGPKDAAKPGCGCDAAPAGPTGLRLALFAWLGRRRR